MSIGRRSMSVYIIQMRIPGSSLANYWSNTRSYRDGHIGLSDNPTSYRNYQQAWRVLQKHKHLKVNAINELYVITGLNPYSARLSEGIMT